MHAALVGLAQGDAEHILIPARAQVAGHLRFGVGRADGRGAGGIFIGLVLVARAQRRRSQHQGVAAVLRLGARLPGALDDDAEAAAGAGGQVGEAVALAAGRRAGGEQLARAVPDLHRRGQRRRRRHLHQQLVRGPRPAVGGRRRGGIAQLQGKLVLQVARPGGRQRALDGQCAARRQRHGHRAGSGAGRFLLGDAGQALGDGRGGLVAHHHRGVAALQARALLAAAARGQQGQRQGHGERGRAHPLTPLGTRGSAGRGWMLARNSASATTVSPTLASPRIFQIAPPLRSGTTSRRSTSPGTTGLRNFTASMPMK